MSSFMSTFEKVDAKVDNITPKDFNRIPSLGGRRQRRQPINKDNSNSNSNSDSDSDIDSGSGSGTNSDSNSNSKKQQ